MISTFLKLYLCGVGLAVVVSLSHIKRKDLKGVKYRKGRAIHYKASISNHLNIRGTANLEAFLFNTMFYRNQKTEDNERGRRWQKLRQEHKQIKN